MTRKTEVSRFLFADLPLGLVTERDYKYLRNGIVAPPIGTPRMRMRVMNCFPGPGYDFDRDHELVDGDNQKKLLEEARREAGARIVDVERETKLKTKALAPRWKKVRGFDVVGTDEDGVRCRSRTWIFKANGADLIYVVRAHTSAAHPGMDDIVDFFMASLREERG